MSLATKLPAAILETILAGLAPLFFIGANSDIAAARCAVARMLDAYHPETEDELCLAASIIGFSFHALEALGRAAQADLSLTHILRLRGSAVSLSRESAKARRHLTQLQKARRQAAPVEIQPEPAHPEPAHLEPAHAEPAHPEAAQPAPPHEPQTAPSPIRNTVKKANGMTWTQAYQQRQRDKRLAARVKPAVQQAITAPDQHTKT